MLAGKYEAPVGWPNRLGMAFPNLPTGYERQSVMRPLTDIRDLRNRVAHHEPILHLDLTRKYGETIEALGWISEELQWWALATCTFNLLWANLPN
jgi:hypothetical protein